MFFTGFADEAAKSLEKQIEATKALGWKNIETRLIDGVFLGKMTGEQYEKVRDIMSRTDVKFNCYGSGVANWQIPPLSEEDYVKTKQELLTAIPRMHELGIKMIRGMSFRVRPTEHIDTPEARKYIFDHVNELVGICKAEGIIYGHENCMNYGGQSWEHTLRLVDNVKYDNFTLIFDTGNPTFLPDRRGNAPYPLQNAMDFYQHVKEHIGYVHIKDSISTINEDGSVKEQKFTYAGDGNGCIPEILTDLFKRGYDGGFSMEPHLAVVFHDKEDPKDEALLEKRKFETYVEYGRRFEKLAARCRKAAGLD